MELKKNKLNWYYMIVAVLLLLSAIIICACSWYNITFGVKIEELLFTITSPLEGADTSFMKEAVRYCLPKIGIVFVGIVLLFFIDRRIRDKNILNGVIRFFRTAIFICSIFSLVFSLKYVNDSLQISNYVKNRLSDTKIYEEYYVDPADVQIISRGEAKNLIYIYLESMETTYASVEEGGEQEVNYMPYLTEMAQENISFSDSDKLGGFQCVTGTGWTMGALMATTSGVPYQLPVEANSMDEHVNFAPGLIALGDILQEKGYYQEFLCGSRAEFGGRKKYFEQHGNYEIFDYETARAEGYIDEDYWVWWGLEDEILYKIAKDELLEISSKKQPFNFTMLTVDSHHVDGYICDLCEDEYPVQIANVISCADKQIYNFVEWCKQQAFYENTIIVITGDHPRMDTSLVENVDYSNRTIYNCFINSEIENKNSVINRVFTPLDIMPTTLAAMGYQFEGERLGLGTNLFSSRQTLAEELSIDYLNSETARYSKYYYENFLQ